MKSHNLSQTTHKWLLTGRWLLLVVAVGDAVVLGFLGGLRGVAVPAIIALCVFEVAALIVVSTEPPERVPIRALLFLDLVFVFVAASATGGSRSLVVPQFFIVIFVAALIRGLWGGLSAGAGAACLAALLALGTPDGWHSTLRQLVPFLLIAGGSTGYLAQGMQTWARRYGESLIREKRKELEDRLAAHERAVEAKIAQREMDLARGMQLAALPADVPQIAGLDIAARSELAEQVGGDFYMFLREGDRTDLIVGDVSGRGIQAAFAATSVAYLLPWLRPLQSPVAALRNLNTNLIQHLPESSFVTLVMAEVDTAAETVRVWSAGHPPALLWRASTQQVEDNTCIGPLLGIGILPCWAGESQEWRFGVGDVLLLYSDGLSEGRNEHGDMFDVRVRDVLAENSAKPAGEILEALFREAKSWGDASDDVTILVCRRTALDD